MTENTGSTSGVFNSTSFNMAKTPDNLIGLIRDAAIELARVYGTDLRVEGIEHDDGVIHAHRIEILGYGLDNIETEFVML